MFKLKAKSKKYLSLKLVWENSVGIHEFYKRIWCSLKMNSSYRSEADIKGVGWSWDESDGTGSFEEHQSKPNINLI